MKHRDREWYGSAVSAGRLQQRAERNTAADVIGAAGLAGARSTMGAALWRAAFANDRAAYAAALAHLKRQVSHAAARRHWPESPRVLKELAGDVLQWKVFGVCPGCLGRGHPGIDGVPTVLSDEPCAQCRGHGWTRIETAIEAQHVDRARDIAQLLDDADENFARAIRARLRGER